MSAIQFYNNKILFASNKVAMDPACCCDEGTIEVDCCENLLPETLTLTVTTDCVALDGVQVTLNWDSGQGRWEGESSELAGCTAGVTLSAIVECESGPPAVFSLFVQLVGTGEEGQQPVLDSAQCDPVQLEFSLTNHQWFEAFDECGCDDPEDYSFTVTE